ncbi:MAG: glucose-6-phosphate dehydrogenase, partial [Candidatus Saccharimonadales bacterium]
RGQYESYRDEVENPASTTETFASLELAIMTERWQGTRLTIKTGKSLSEKRTEIVLTFATPQDNSHATNTLTFRLQPNEGIHLQLRVKKPGFVDELQEAVMDFSYSQAFGTDSSHPSAYERVLVDAIRGDRTLFATSGEVLASWRIIEPVITAWQGNDTDLHSYPSGSDGPDIAR